MLISIYISTTSQADLLEINLIVIIIDISIRSIFKMAIGQIFWPIVLDFHHNSPKNFMNARPLNFYASFEETSFQTVFRKLQRLYKNS